MIIAYFIVTQTAVRRPFVFCATELHYVKKSACSMLSIKNLLVERCVVKADGVILTMYHAGDSEDKKSKVLPVFKAWHCSVNNTLML